MEQPTLTLRSFIMYMCDSLGGFLAAVMLINFFAISSAGAGMMLGAVIGAVALIATTVA